MNIAGLLLWATLSHPAPIGQAVCPPPVLPAESTLAQVRAKKPARRPGKPRPAPTPAPEPEPAPASESAAAPAPGGGAPVGLSGTTRIEFDGQQIKGQTTKAGEVQVLERKDTELKSMVKRRTSFRDEIIQTVFPDHRG